MSIFQFKQFSIIQANSAMKVGTDAMVLGALVDVNGKLNGLDIGTGTGVLPLMLTQKNKQLHFTGLELDQQSALEATLNFKNASWYERLNCIQADFTHHTFSEQFDLIVSNPPYYENGLLSDQDRKMSTKHETRLSLQVLFEKTAKLLMPGGHFWVILPATNADKWKDVAKKMGLYCEKEIVVYGKPQKHVRTIFSFHKGETTWTQEELIIRNDSNDYTEMYKELTRDFHAVTL
jgi:tRNA1Val (adenine37-N6)-methyltransferase